MGRGALCSGPSGDPIRQSVGAHHGAIMTTVARKILKGWGQPKCRLKPRATIIYVIAGVMKSKQWVNTFTLMAQSLFFSTGSIETSHKRHITLHI